MRRLIFLLILVSSKAYSICDFPHSPPAYCLEYEIEGEAKKEKKYSPYNCEYKLKSFVYFRPAKTFHFNEKLDRIVSTKKSKVDLTQPDRIKKSNKVYSKSCQLPKKGKLLVFLNCYDAHENIPDFSVVTEGKAKGVVFETRNQKNIEFDCN